jgi:HK97 family phage prohead protease
MILERRSAKLIEARADQDQYGPRIIGTAAVYDSICDPLMGFEETVKRGFFAPVLGKTDTVCIFNHDNNWVLGRTTSNLLDNGKHTLELEDAPDGLHFTCYPPETVFARAALENIRRGDVKQCSFQFTIADEKWGGTSDKPTRELISCDRLFDVSPVTFAAYPATSVDLRTVLTAGGVNMRDFRDAYIRRQIDGQSDTKDSKILTDVRDLISRLLNAAGVAESPVEKTVDRELDEMAMRLALEKLR